MKVFIVQREQEDNHVFPRYEPLKSAKHAMAAAMERQEEDVLSMATVKCPPLETFMKERFVPHYTATRKESEVELTIEPFIGDTHPVVLSVGDGPRAYMVSYDTVYGVTYRKLQEVLKNTGRLDTMKEMLSQCIDTQIDDMKIAMIRNQATLYLHDAIVSMYGSMSRMRLAILTDLMISLP